MLRKGSSGGVDPAILGGVVREKERGVHLFERGTPRESKIHGRRHGVPHIPKGLTTRSGVVLQSRRH